MAEFRFHRGSFKESMKTMVKVDDMQELLRVLNDKKMEFEPEILTEHVETDVYGYHGNWKRDTFFVSVYNPRTKTASIVGFIDKNIKEE